MSKAATREQQAVILRVQLANAYMQREELDQQIKALRNLIAGLEYKEQPPEAPTEAE